MEFIREVDAAEYDAFVKNHPLKSHFMQSWAWGEFSRVQKGLIPHYIGLRGEDGNLCAAALLLERKPPLFPPYFYAPRGFVLDFFDEALLARFTKEVRAFARSRGAMFVALDPDIERWQIDARGDHTEGFDNTPLIEQLKRLGYRHRGFNQAFEGRQPRYTFRIDLEREQKEIEKGIVGNVMKNVRKSRGYASEVAKGTSQDIPTLHRLIHLTSERDDFVGYDESYYQNFYDVLAQHDMATLYLGITHPAQSTTLLENALQDVLKKRETLKKPGPLAESIATEERLRREITQFRTYAEQYPPRRSHQRTSGCPLRRQVMGGSCRKRQYHERNVPQ